MYGVGKAWNRPTDSWSAGMRRKYSGRRALRRDGDIDSCIRTVTKRCICLLSYSCGSWTSGRLLVYSLSGSLTVPQRDMSDGPYGTNRTHAVVFNVQGSAGMYHIAYSLHATCSSLTCSTELYDDRRPTHSVKRLLDDRRRNGSQLDTSLLSCAASPHCITAAARSSTLIESALQACRKIWCIPSLYVHSEIP